MKSRKRNRMKGYDYSKDNLYFVTSCVKNMVCCFGEVMRTGRDLSVAGGGREMDDDLRTGRDLSVPDYGGFSMDLDKKESAMVVLNEYGIIAKDQILWLENQYSYAVVHSYVVMPNHVHMVIEIDSSKSKRDFPDIPIKIKSLSQLLGAYKTTTSKMIHTAGYTDFSWHRSFHDHIIRDEKAYSDIVNYINKNPQKWLEDKFYKKK